MSDHLCHECGKPFERKRTDSGDKPKVYCSYQCRRDANNREAMRAKKVYRFLIHWRKKRGVDAKYEFGMMCAMIDKFITEDREAGRPLPRLPSIQEVEL